MNKQKSNSKKALPIFVGSLMGWLFVTTTVVNRWAPMARSESAVGTTEFFLREMLTNTPHYIYSMVIYSIFAIFLEKKESVLWTVLTAVTAMCIYALMSQDVFLQGISYLEIGILLNYYAVPLAFAVAGALTVHTIRDRKKQDENVEA